MSYNIVLLDSRTKDINGFNNGINENTTVILYDYFNDTYETILDKLNGIANITNLAIGNESSYLKYSMLLKEKSIILNKLNTLTDFSYFLKKIVQKYNVQAIDFLSCNIGSEKSWILLFNNLNKNLNIKIRGSKDITGFSGNFIQEIGNVDLKTLYFTSKINDWNGNFFTYTNSSAYGTNKLLYDISKNVIYLHKDINDTPVNIRYNSDGTDYENTNILDMLAWGNPDTGGNLVSGDFTTIKSVYSTNTAFAALKQDGTVIAWGEAVSGADITGVNSTLNSGSPVSSIYSTNSAFAALKADGRVITWGDPDTGGSTTSVDSSLNSDFSANPVVSIFSTNHSFAALKHNGKVIAWGNPTYGGDLSLFDASLNNDFSANPIVTITSTRFSFAALKKNGTVIAWGDSVFGGDLSAVNVLLNTGSRVKVIYSSTNSFIALKFDGTVIAWGATNVTLEPDIVNSIVTNDSGFAVIKNDNTVVTYGDYSGGLSYSSVKQVYSTWGDYAVLKTNGTVESTLNIPANLNTGSTVKCIFSSQAAFAALKLDGSVVVWGEHIAGGDASGLDLTNVKTIFSSYSAFVAIKNDGTIVSWGDTNYGGNSSSLNITNAKNIYSTESAFVVLIKSASPTLDFFINHPIILQKDTTLFVSNQLPYNIGNYDYVISINVGYEPNSLFDMKTYKQSSNISNTSGENLVDIELVVNKSFINDKLTSSFAQIYKGRTECIESGLVATEQKFGLRLLEIMAIKIFGHAKARAAIENDSEFYYGDNISNSVINQLITGMNMYINMEGNSIFNSYVQTDKIETDAVSNNTYNDVDVTYIFNFKDTNWIFPAYLNGSLFGTGTGDLNLLNNGPSVGGNQLTNGLYNIPVLIIFEQQL
jgi:alpha-tubulin suppressor-like RCC1 family protein